MIPCLQISEQVWIPYNRISRISLFGNTVTITTDYGIEQVYGEDAERVLKQLKTLL